VKHSCGQGGGSATKPILFYFLKNFNLLLQSMPFILNEHKQNVLHLVQNITSYLNSWQ
jgi:hypothetical protein